MLDEREDDLRSWFRVVAVEGKGEEEFFWIVTLSAEEAEEEEAEKKAETVEAENEDSSGAGGVVDMLTMCEAEKEPEYEGLNCWFAEMPWKGNK